MKDYEKEAALIIDRLFFGTNPGGPAGLATEAATQIMASDPLRRLLGPEAVKQLMEGKAAVVPTWKGEHGTYIGKASSWELKIGNCDLEDIRLDKPSKEGA